MEEEARAASEKKALAEKKEVNKKGKRAPSSVFGFYFARKDLADWDIQSKASQTTTVQSFGQSRLSTLPKWAGDRVRAESALFGWIPEGAQKAHPSENGDP
jgi:hypothetical protein